MLLFVCFPLSVNLFWYVLFHFYTTDYRYVDPRECIFLINSGREICSFYIYILIFFVATIFISCLQICFKSYLAIIGWLIISVMFLIIYLAKTIISMTKSVSKGEECGDYRTFSIVWLIYNYFTITFALCILLAMAASGYLNSVGRVRF
jgi:hypothetical protein